MQGTTTNEYLRNKWNAKRQKEQQIKVISKAKFR
jgi:hypothetical protein